MVTARFVPPVLHEHYHTFAVEMAVVRAESHHELTTNGDATAFFLSPEYPMDLLLHLPESSFSQVWHNGDGGVILLAGVATMAMAESSFLQVWPQWRWRSNHGIDLNVRKRTLPIGREALLRCLALGALLLLSHPWGILVEEDRWA